MENYYDYGPDDDMILSSRLYPDSYTTKAIENIRLLSLNPEESVPFGSFIYKVQKYPGDIDILETYEDCCTIDQVVKKVAKKLQNIIKNIVSLRSHYMTEAKFGEDLRYDPSISIIGYLDKGVYHLNDKTRENLVAYSDKLLNRDLITEEEYEIILAIVERDFPTAYDYDVLYNLFREHRVLRWNTKEVLQGYKILPENIKMKLEDALKMKAHVKIDMITNLNGKFIEMTNFFFLVVKKLDGKDYLINFHREYDEDYLLHRSETELPKEIEKLFFSKYYFNPFKGVKRIWALARHYKDYSMINKLKDFISGNISLLYQLKSEIGNIMLLLEKLKTYPKVGINNQIQDIKSRLVYVLELGEDEEIVDQWFNQATAINDKYNKYQALNKIKKYLESAINYFTLEYLEHIGLTYLRYPYVPREQSYNTNKMLNSDAMLKFEKEEEQIRKLEKRNKNIRLQEEMQNEKDFEDQFYEQLEGSGISQQQYNKSKKEYDNYRKQYNLLYNKQDETNWRQLKPQMDDITKVMRNIDQTILLPYMMENNINSGGSCWNDFLKSKRFKDVYEDFMEYNNCKVKKQIYTPKKYVKSKPIPIIKESIKIPEELTQQEEFFEPPPPPPSTINVRPPKPPTPPLMTLEQKKQFELEKDERKKAKEEKQIKESKKTPGMSDIAAIMKKAAEERNKKLGIKEETFGTGCLTCPKAKLRQSLIRKLRNYK